MGAKSAIQSCCTQNGQNSTETGPRFKVSSKRQKWGMDRVTPILVVLCDIYYNTTTPVYVNLYHYSMLQYNLKSYNNSCIGQT